MRNVTTTVLTVMVMFVLFCGNTASGQRLTNEDEIKNCDFSVKGEWWNNQDYPLEVPRQETFCDFYQFSWEWFLYLISPASASDPTPRFQNQEAFPILELPVLGENSCDNKMEKKTLFVRSSKSVDDSAPFLTPTEFKQAESESIFDQNENIVYYTIRFSRNLCDEYQKILGEDNFPPGTVELKMAWKVMDDVGDLGNYYTTEEDIAYELEGEVSALVDAEVTLGLIGFHVAVATENHPEFIWFTMEHRNNAIDCGKIGLDSPADESWSFTSKECANGTDGCIFNNPTEANDITDDAILAGDPTEICRSYPFGTEPSQETESKNYLNIKLLEKLDEAMVETFSDSADPSVPGFLKVWENYFMVGSIWVSDIAVPSDRRDNQRGSLKLANAVMETEYQGGNYPGGKEAGHFLRNCFSCHRYRVDEKNTAIEGSDLLSHIFDDIVKGIRENGKK